MPQTALHCNGRMCKHILHCNAPFNFRSTSSAWHSQLHFTAFIIACRVMEYNNIQEIECRSFVDKAFSAWFYRKNCDFSADQIPCFCEQTRKSSLRYCMHFFGGVAKFLIQCFYRARTLPAIFIRARYRGARRYFDHPPMCVLRRDAKNCEICGRCAFWTICSLFWKGLSLLFPPACFLLSTKLPQPVLNHTKLPPLPKNEDPPNPVYLPVVLRSLDRDGLPLLKKFGIPDTKELL